MMASPCFHFSFCVFKNPQSWWLAEISPTHGVLMILNIFSFFLRGFCYFSSFSSRIFNFSFCFQPFYFYVKWIQSLASPTKGLRSCMFFLFLFFIFVFVFWGVIRSKKSLGARITDRAEKMKKNTWSLIMYLYLFDLLDDLLFFYRFKLLDHIMLSFQFLRMLAFHF